LSCFILLLPAGCAQHINRYLDYSRQFEGIFYADGQHVALTGVKFDVVELIRSTPPRHILPHWYRDLGMGSQNWKFYRILEYKWPAWHIPCTIPTKFLGSLLCKMVN